MHKLSNVYSKYNPHNMTVRFQLSPVDYGKDKIIYFDHHSTEVNNAFVLCQKTV